MTFQITIHAEENVYVASNIAADGKPFALSVFHAIGRLFETAPGVFALRISAREGFFFDRITIKCPSPVSAPPRWAHSTSDDTYTIGQGGEYFPPRAIMIRRFVCAPWWRRLAAWAHLLPAPWRAIYALRPKVTKHEHLALDKDLSKLKGKYDAIGEQILEAIRTGQPNPNADLHFLCGVWMPMGEMDKGAVGGKGIEAFPGWELSALYRIISHDLTMERMAISNEDENGEPKTARRPEYFTTRGWGVSTQLSEFCAPLTLTPGDDRRIPRDLNTGTCWYREFFVPSANPDDFYARQRYLPYDDEHLCRGTRHAKAAAFLYGDPVALVDLEAIAADANAGVHLFDKDQLIFGNMVARYPDHKGCDRYGRGLAWSLNAIQCVEKPWARDAEIEIVGELLRVQDTDTGSYQVCKPPPNQPQGWAPDPYVAYNFPGDTPIVHTLELSYLALGVALAGHTRSAERAAAFMSMTPPNQWIAAVPGAQPQVGVGESYSVWCLWGVLAESRPVWREVMQRMVPPGAQAVAGENVHAALIAAGNFEASAKAIEASE